MSGNWASLRERGGILGMRLTAMAYRFLGDSAARLLLYPVVAYFFVTGRTARRASRAYLNRLWAHSRGKEPPPTLLDSFRHMFAFAESALDKFAAWTGDITHQAVSFPDRSDFEALRASGKGALILGSHLGNLEMTRALAAAERLASITAVVYTDHARRFNRLLEKANAEFPLNLLQVSDFGPATAIMMKDRIDRGEWLVIVGDRTPASDSGRVAWVDFLGVPAPFAEGPIILASLLECQVFLMFCIKQADAYSIHFERFADRVELPRKEREIRIREYLQRYAGRLQDYCHEAPLQWFNFFDFWRDGFRDGPAVDETAAGRPHAPLPGSPDR